MPDARASYRSFLCPADSGWWLAILRVGLGLQLILYLCSLRGEWLDLFGRAHLGFVNRALSEAIISSETSFTPRLGWTIDVLHSLGLTEAGALWVVWMTLFTVSACLVVGLYCRAASILAWFLYLSCVKSGALFAYGVDNFTTIGLFYLMIAPLPDKWSLEYSWRTNLPVPQRVGLHRRVLQLHLCVIYFFSGISKCLGADWWNGNSIWRALTRPPFNLVSPSLLLHFIWLLPALGISVCVLETGYAIFIWGSRTRTPWLLGILSLHIGIGLTMGLYLFALIMIILNISAFGPDFSLVVKNALLSRHKSVHDPSTGKG